MTENKNNSKPIARGLPIIITAITIIFLIVIFKFVIFKTDSAVSLANSGIKLLSEEKFSESESKFARAQAEDPEMTFVDQSSDPAMVCVGLGNRYMAIPDALTAGRNYQIAFRIDSTIDFRKYTRFMREDFVYPEGLYLSLGNFFWSQENKRFSRAAYEKVLNINPDHIAALTNLANIERSLENDSEAKKKYNRALTVDPQAYEARVNLISMAIVDDDIEAFRYHLEKLEEYHPEKPMTTLFQGHLEKNEGNFDKAAELFQQFLELKPDDLLATLGMADCLRELGKHEEAQKLLEQSALKHGALGQIHERALQNAEAAFHEKKFDKAAAFYERMISIWPEDPEFMFGKANCLLNLDEYSEARSIYEDLLQRFPQSSSVLTNLGLAYIFIEKPEWAKEQFEAAIAIDSPPITFYNYGRLLEAEGDTAMAGSMFIKAAMEDQEFFNLEGFVMNVALEKQKKLEAGDSTGLHFVPNE